MPIEDSATHFEDIIRYVENEKREAEQERLKLKGIQKEQGNLLQTRKQCLN